MYIFAINYMVCYSRSERAETGVAKVANKSKVENLVMQVVCNDKVIALKLKGKAVNVLFEQVYMATSEYADEVEELHAIT